MFNAACSWRQYFCAHKITLLADEKNERQRNRLNPSDCLASKLYCEDYISNIYFSIFISFFHLLEKWKVKTPNLLGFWPSHCPQEGKHDLEDYCSPNRSVNGSSVGIAISRIFTTQVLIPQGLFTINIFMLPIKNSRVAISSPNWVPTDQCPILFL